MGNLPWVEKYRPSSLGDLVSQEEIVNALSKMVAEDRLPHLLFYGPPGTGKTSTILAMARKMFSQKGMQTRVLELNASDERGISVVRDKIVSFASSQGLHDVFSFSADSSSLSFSEKRQIKLVILDEADAMTKDAQNALRRIIEKYTDSTRFCIICNYLSRIIPALQSRCTRFRFAPLKAEQAMPRLEHIIEKESLSIADEAKAALFKLSRGDMRRMINILQSCALSSSDSIDEESVYRCVGYPHPKVVEQILRILMDSTTDVAVEKISNIRLRHGIALMDILEELLDKLNQMELPNKMVESLYSGLAKIEFRLAAGCTEALQSAALVGTFLLAREQVFDKIGNGKGKNC